MTRAEVIALLGSRDPLAVAAGLPVPAEVGWLRGNARGEGIEVVHYGAGTTDAEVADRLLDIATRAGDVRAVLLVPGGDTAETPGSWGNEDLLVTAVARRVLPGVPIRPDWVALGEPACQVAVSFGADEWVIFDGVDADPDHLAEAVGARAVAR